MEHRSNEEIIAELEASIRSGKPGQVVKIPAGASADNISEAIKRVFPEDKEAESQRLAMEIGALLLQLIRNELRS